MELEKRKNIQEAPTLRSRQYIASQWDDKDHVNKLLNQQKLHQILNNVPLKEIPVFNKQNMRQGQKCEWTISIATFRQYLNQNTRLMCVPLIMSYDSRADGMEYLVIMKTESSKCDIGISFKYDSKTKGIGKIRGLHIDIGMIMEQHQLAMTHDHNLKCICLESWIDSPIITHLKVIGDLDQFEVESKEDTEHEEYQLLSNCIYDHQSLPLMPSYSDANLSSTATLSSINTPSTSVETNECYLISCKRIIECLKELVADNECFIS